GDPHPRPLPGGEGAGTGGWKRRARSWLLVGPGDADEAGAVAGGGVAGDGGDVDFEGGEVAFDPGGHGFGGGAGAAVVDGDSEGWTVFGHGGEAVAEETEGVVAPRGEGVEGEA